MVSRKPLRTKENRRESALPSVDYPFLILVLLLLAVGLTMLYSASYAQSEYDTGYLSSTKYLKKQGICALIGLIAMYFFSRIPARFWSRMSWPVYCFLIVIVLCLVLFCLYV